VNATKPERKISPAFSFAAAGDLLYLADPAITALDAAVASYRRQYARNREKPVLFYFS